MLFFISEFCCRSREFLFGSWIHPIPVPVTSPVNVYELGKELVSWRGIRTKGLLYAELLIRYIQAD